MNSNREILPQKIENLDALVNLEELWLGKNKITKLEVSASVDLRCTSYNSPWPYDRICRHSRSLKSSLSNLIELPSLKTLKR